eukprot:scaffold2874_cov110-Alexandrium_tamarense.AAC.6
MNTSIQRKKRHPFATMKPSDWIVALAIITALVSEVESSLSPSTSSRHKGSLAFVSVGHHHHHRLQKLSSTSNDRRSCWHRSTPMLMLNGARRCSSLRDTIRCATSLSMSSSQQPMSSSRSTSASPWSPGTWKITLDFGREDSSSNSLDKLSGGEEDATLSSLLGEEWGANGVRLALPFEMLVTAETTTSKASNADKPPPIQTAWIGGKPTGSIQCLPKATTNSDGSEYSANYINSEGLQYVQISPGQWRIEPPLPLLTSSSGKVLKGQASTLRYYLTLNTAIRRNTIHFPENQLLLLQSNTFRPSQYLDGVRTVLPYQYAKDNSQKMLEEQLNHETGDRRLDGNDLIETLEGYKDVAGLVWERDEKRRKWREVEGALPVITDSTTANVDVEAMMDDDDKWGIWPGDTELLTIERGVILAVVERKEKKKGMFPWMDGGGGNAEDTVLVGRWTATPMFDEDDYDVE